MTDENLNAGKALRVIHNSDTSRLSSQYPGYLQLAAQIERFRGKHCYKALKMAGLLLSGKLMECEVLYKWSRRMLWTGASAQYIVVADEA